MLRIEDRGSFAEDRGSRIGDRGTSGSPSGILGPRASIIDSGPSILDPRSPIRDPESSILDPRSAIPDPRSPILDPESSVAPIEPHHRSSIQQLLRATGVFAEHEVQVALEVIDSYFILPEGDYTALGAFTPGSELLGYVCYGPTPCTVGTWDLYWIAVAPEAQGSGVGSQLLQEVERRLALKDARLVIIETSSQPHYAATRAFYERRGYQVVARVPDFYTEGDDRLIYAKRIHVT